MEKPLEKLRGFPMVNTERTKKGTIMERRPSKWIPVCAMVATALTVWAPARADEAPGEKKGPTLEDLEARLKRQAELLAEQQRALEAQEKKLREYKVLLDRLLAEERLRQQELARLRAAGAPGAGADAPGAAASPPEPAREKARVAQAPRGEAPPVGQAPEPVTRPPVVAPITDAVNVLTPRAASCWSLPSSTPTPPTPGWPWWASPSSRPSPSA